MKIKLVTVGKIKDKNLNLVIEEFEKRIARFIKFEMMSVTSDEKLPALMKDVRSVVFDERGKSFSSETFARFLEKFGIDGVKEVVFVIGGPTGLPEQVKKMANYTVRLSDMTLNNDIAVLLALEQIYRAYTILTNHPYHYVRK